MKRVIIIGVVVLTIFTLSLGCSNKTSTLSSPAASPSPASTSTSVSPASAAPKITFKFTKGTGERKNDPIRHFADLLSERSNGRITLDVIWGGALAKPGEEVEAIGRGLAEMGEISTASNPEKFILSNITYSVPFNTRDTKQMLEIGDKLFQAVPEMDQEFEKYNTKRLWNDVFASYELQSTVPIKSLADLKGLKIACIGSTMPRWFEKIGAVPVAMGVPDRYSAFQTGMIQAEVFPLSYAASFKWTDIAKYATILGLGTNLSLAPAINIDAWNKLSPSDQQLILDVSNEAAAWNANQAMVDESQVRNDWETNLGVTFYDLPAADKAAWAQELITEPYDWAKEWDAKGYAATKTLNAFLQISKDVGYTYPVEWSK
jgi:TRAP-type C4-dicarboxylate transport system substrate-binding protein